MTRPTLPEPAVHTTPSAPAPIAYISELWRYPVKSMRGERVESLEVLPDGIAHDRRYAFVSSGAPAGKPRLTGRERAAMLGYCARASARGTQVTAPQGQIFAVDDPELLLHLEAHLPGGNRMALEHGTEAPPYTDVRPIALVSTQTLALLDRTLGRPVDPRRFRANLVLTFFSEAEAELAGLDSDSFPEDALQGRMLRLGSTCRLRILERIPRCRVVTLDPETTQSDPALMKHLDRQFGGRAGVYARVEEPGSLRVGDPAVLSLLPGNGRPTE